MQNMETRYTHSPADIRHYSTEQLRDEFLVEKVFIPGAISLTYTHNDRMIFGGVTPTTEELEIILDKELGVDYFLERRELGVMAIILGKKQNMFVFLQKTLIIQRNFTLVVCQHITNIPT